MFGVRKFLKRSEQKMWKEKKKGISNIEDDEGCSVFRLSIYMCKEKL